MSDLTPVPTTKGITLWPIPDFDGVSVAFGADTNSYFARHDLPDVPQKYVDMANNLFFSGGKLPELAPCVDKAKAAKAIRALLASFGPSHEAKEATVGYALWLWSTPSALTTETVA